MATKATKTCDYGRSHIKEGLSWAERKQERYEGTSRPVSHRKAQEDERDPVIAAFLRFIEKQTAVHLDDIVEADSDHLRRIGKLVTGAWQWISPAPECQWMDPNIDE